VTILTLRTDNPEAEIGLFHGSEKAVYEVWTAHRELAETIHKKLEEILNKSSILLEDVQGIVIFEGPGSFTGLRIGMSVANALAYSLEVPIIASAGKNWQQDGIQKIQSGKSDKIAIPEYGEAARTTKPRK
jgi:tRNA threonylcarbamoyladenosine biosynthesis protein TsaB